MSPSSPWRPRATALALATSALLTPALATAAGQAPGRGPGGWTFEHAAFRVSLPRSWQVAEFDPATRRHRKAQPGGPDRTAAGQVAFADGKGNYFSVSVDQPLDFEADAVWTLRGDPSGGIEVVSEGSRCRPAAGASRAEDDDCPAGDGWLAIGTYAVQVRGRHYAFFFGNTAREDGVPLAVFREILRSFRAR